MLKKNDMRSRFIPVVFLVLVAGVTTSCKKNHYKVNTSSINVKIEIKRLEKDLFTLNPDQVIPMVPSLKKKYGGFLQLFSSVINTGDINESSFGDMLLRFCSDKQNNEVYGLTMKKYPDVAPIEKGLQEAFSHYLYYFPGRAVPAVFT